MNAAERGVLEALVRAWNEFVALPRQHRDELTEFKDGIHRCQSLIAVRVARRADPDLWSNEAEGVGDGE